jgi:hypothetical protein
MKVCTSPVKSPKRKYKCSQISQIAPLIIALALNVPNSLALPINTSENPAHKSRAILLLWYLNCIAGQEACFNSVR